MLCYNSNWNVFFDTCIFIFEYFFTFSTIFLTCLMLWTDFEWSKNLCWKVNKMFSKSNLRFQSFFFFFLDAFSCPLLFFPFFNFLLNVHYSFHQNSFHQFDAWVGWVFYTQNKRHHGACLYCSLPKLKTWNESTVVVVQSTNRVWPSKISTPPYWNIRQKSQS